MGEGQLGSPLKGGGGGARLRFKNGLRKQNAMLPLPPSLLVPYIFTQGPLYGFSSIRQVELLRAL